jgi:6-pyruvoyltetrahydropterin/6-carboxytetrahydropterin synthase
MLYITRKEHFSASHELNNPKLTKKRNETIFGKCNSFHGHNYYIEVTLYGEPDVESGYVFDLKKLSNIISKEILQKVDHKYLNELDIFKNIIPTTENMAKIFWEILNPKLKTNNAQLYSIKLYETEKNIVEYKG